MTKQDLDIRTDTDVDALFGDAAPTIEDPAEVQKAIVVSLLQAGSLRELFRDTKTTATRELLDTPIVVRSIQLRRSTIEGANGAYMLIDAARLDTGETVTLNTGAPNIMAILWRAGELGELPLEVKVVEAAAAAPGKSAPLTLKPVGRTAELIKA